MESVGDRGQVTFYHYTFLVGMAIMVLIVSGAIGGAASNSLFIKVLVIGVGVVGWLLTVVSGYGIGRRVGMLEGLHEGDQRTARAVKHVLRLHKIIPEESD